jgi:oxygen-independent coproporphyrinogen-3 oxidase
MQIKEAPGRGAHRSCMDITGLIERYDARIPRYTSYPTAPHFGPAVDGEVYRGWLAALPDDEAVSLYFHVPFCASLCLFCACHTTVVRKPEPIAAYARTMMDEIDRVADAIGRRQIVRQIHWGGGSPTALAPESFIALMEHVRRRFDVAEDAEIAVEIDPRTLTPAHVDAYGAIGVTRASLGLQDLDPAVQKAINRHQSYDETAEAADRMRRLGISSINLDLIYGLPFQTVEGVAATARRALGIEPDRVAVFGYAHVPWMKKHQRLMPEEALPGTAERFRQREVVDEVMAERGYATVGLDHFAKPDDALAVAAANGTLRRNFQGYTADPLPTVIGFGASSIGSMPQGYVQNTSSAADWRDAVRAGRLPTARGIELDADDRLRRDVIERLMCRLEVDLAEIADQHQLDVRPLLAAAPRLQTMQADGLLDWQGTRVRMTPAGRPFVRAAAAAFDARLAAGAGRHSAAI